MDLEKVKLIIKNMESLITILKQEIEPYTPMFDDQDLVTPLEEDYDEVYVDEI